MSLQHIGRCHLSQLVQMPPHLKIHIMVFGFRNDNLDFLIFVQIIHKVMLSYVTLHSTYVVLAEQ